MQKKETCQRKAQVHAIEPTAPALGGRRPVVMPDPHSTIQEEEPESKPTFGKQVSTLSVFFYRVLFVNKSTLRTLTGTLWHQQCRPLSPSSTHLRCLVSEGSNQTIAAAAMCSNHSNIFRSREPRDREVSPALTSAGRRSSKTLPRGFSLSQVRVGCRLLKTHIFCSRQLPRVVIQFMGYMEISSTSGTTTVTPRSWVERAKRSTVRIRSWTPSHTGCQPSTAGSP